MTTPATAAPTLPPTPPMPVDELPSLPSIPPPLPEPLPQALPASTSSTSAPRASSSQAALAAIGGEGGRPSPWRQVFPDLLQAYERGQFLSLICLAEEAEVVYPAVKARPTRLLVTIPLVLSYLCMNQLPPAYWALGRLPRVLQTFAPTRALQELLSALATQSYALIPQAAQNLVAVTTGSLKGESELDLAIGPMVEGFLQTYRTRLVEVLGRGYACLSPKEAAAYLGQSTGEAVSAFCKAGWTVDDTTGSLFPPGAGMGSKPLVNGAIAAVCAPSRVPAYTPSTLADFTGIANGASRLENVV